MKNQNLVVLLLLFILTSCSKENNVVEIQKTTNRVEKSLLPDILQHYEHLTTPTSGYLSIKSYRTLANKNRTEGSYQTGGLVLDNHGEPNDFGLLTIGDIQMQSEPNRNFMYGLNSNEGQQFYGTTTNFQLGSILESTPMYIPQLIEITNYNQSTNPSFGIGSEINWNSDVQNSLGVLIIVSYHVVDNPSMGNSYPETIKDVVLVEDDGNYIFTNDFLNKFPVGAKLKVELARGNYKIETAIDGRNLTLWAYTIMGGILKYE